MADQEKLRALHEALKKHDTKLEELQGHANPQQETESRHDVLIETRKIVQNLLEVLGEMGL
jgi:hypothetical protein